MGHPQPPPSLWADVERSPDIYHMRKNKFYENICNVTLFLFISKAQVYLFVYEKGLEGRIPHREERPPLGGEAEFEPRLSHW